MIGKHGARPVSTRGRGFAVSYSPQGPARPVTQRGTRHLIADVRYTAGQPGDEAPLTCACGWQGPANIFQAHRRAAGERPLSFSEGLARGYS